MAPLGQDFDPENYVVPNNPVLAAPQVNQISQQEPQSVVPIPNYSGTAPFAPTSLPSPSPQPLQQATIPTPPASPSFNPDTYTLPSDVNWTTGQADAIRSEQPEFLKGSPFGTDQTQFPKQFSPEQRGQAFEKALSPAWGYEEAFTTGVSRGAVGNFGERLDALAHAGWNKVTNNDDPETYDERVRKNDAYVAALQQDYPWTTLGGQILGLMGPAIGLGKVWSITGGPTTIGLPIWEKLAAMAPVGRAAHWANVGAQIAGRLPVTAIQSGALGAWMGFNTGQKQDNQSEWDNRVEQAKQMILPSALWGMGIDAALGIAGGFFGASRTPGLDAQGKRINPAERVAEAEKFGLKGDASLTAGQATGNLAQQGYEQAARSGSYGEAPQKLIGERMTKQAAAIQEARANLVPEVSGVDVGEVFPEKILQRVKAAESTADSLYGGMRTTQTEIRPDSVAGLARNVLDKLKERGIYADTDLTGLPRTKQAMNILRERLSGFNDVPYGPWLPQPLDTAEVTRRMLRDMSLRGAAGGTDADGVRAIYETFDNFMSQLTTHDLFNPTPEGLGLLEQGKLAAKEYLSLLDEHTALGQLIKEGLGTDSVANWATNAATINPDVVKKSLTSANTVSGADKGARLIRAFKGYFGDNTPEMDALRGSVWKNMTSAPEGQPAWGAERTAKAMIAYVDGPGRMLARELHNPTEIQAIRDAAKIIRWTIPDPNIPNTSHTAYELFRKVGEYISLPSVLGMAAGFQEYSQSQDPKEALYHTVAGAMAGFTMQRLGPGAYRARSALKPLATPGAISAPIARVVGPSIAKGRLDKQKEQQGHTSGGIARAVTAARRFSEQAISRAR